MDHPIDLMSFDGQETGYAIKVGRGVDNRVFIPMRAIDMQANFTYRIDGADIVICPDGITYISCDWLIKYYQESSSADAKENINKLEAIRSKFHELKKKYEHIEYAMH